MAKLLVMSLPTRQDAVTIIHELLENGVKREALSVLAKTEEALGKVCLETGLPKPLRGDGNHALFHPLIEVSSILERKAVNVAAAGAAGRLLGGAEIGCGSDDLVTSLEGIGIPLEDARDMEQALLKDNYLLFMEGNETTPWNAIGKLLEKHKHITIYPA